MTVYTLFTDPHIGTRRAAHTTRESSKRLTAALYEQALSLSGRESNSVCLGDLFDRSFNDEATLVQGHAVASQCRWVLAGNHDSTNRSDTVTSLDALKEMGCPIISAADLSEPYFDCFGALYFVPHHASQELFEVALTRAAAHASVCRAGKPSVLFLHCNYEQPFAAEDDTLNLTQSMAEQLLNDFDYIFLGHEHRPARYLDGRVVVLGNTHPTSFADISDKFVYLLDITDSRIDLKAQRIWSQATKFAEVRFGEPLPDLSTAEFVDVVGLAEAGAAVAVSDFIQSVWAAAPGALAVRNSVVLGQAFQESDAGPEVGLEGIRERISKELAGGDLEELFLQLAGEVEA